MNPYEANPSKIPENDMYINEPLYGRYYPQPTDFKPDPNHVNSVSTESLQYWTSVLHQCNESNRAYDNPDGGRDVFVLGMVIVKSTHLKPVLEGRKAFRDYSFADANEVKATFLARSVLKDVKVPEIYFAGKINGRDVLIQERIPGVGLNVAWQYLSLNQKASFKDQARKILQQLHSIKPPESKDPKRVHPSYLVPDPDPVDHRGIQPLEQDILFSNENVETDMDEGFGFMHNDFSVSNTIVDNDKIVGLVDWEMAGFFGWKRAAEVHVKIRSRTREDYAQANVTEEKLADILFWNDLYIWGPVLSAFVGVPDAVWEAVTNPGRFHPS